jgi:glycerophosphoryl diester phosphodiesterase
VNPWLERRVLAYAHRGGAREAPSSTLYAMRRALEAGADALELDVHATADGHLVCCHDTTVDRTTNGRGAIASLTLAEVQALDNAFFFVPGEEAAPGLPPEAYPLRGRAPADPELRVPRLEEVLEAFPSAILNLDIKQTAPAVEPYEAELAKLLRSHRRVEDVIVASFSDRALEVFRAEAPEIPTAAGPADAASFVAAVRSGAELPRLACVALQLPVTVGGTRVVDGELVSRAHEAGLAVHAWTVDDPEEMRELVALGVDGIMTDRPSVLVSVLRELKASFRA